MRKGITDIALLQRIIQLLASSIGSPISAKKISDTLNASGRRISVNTVDTYLQALLESYIFYKTDRYDVKGRSFLNTRGKYYIVDLGLRNNLLVRSKPNLGPQIENLVYLELLRRGYEVSSGKLAEKEIDFVAQTAQSHPHYQVAASVLDENTLMRERAPLKAIPDHYPKVLLTLDVIGSGTNIDGIQRKNLLDWVVGDDLPHR